MRQLADKEIRSVKPLSKSKSKRQAALVSYRGGQGRFAFPPAARFSCCFLPAAGVFMLVPAGEVFTLSLAGGGGVHAAWSCL